MSSHLGTSESKTSKYVLLGAMFLISAVLLIIGALGFTQGGLVNSIDGFNCLISGVVILAVTTISTFVAKELSFI